MKRAIIFFFLVVYPNIAFGFDSDSFNIQGVKLGMKYNEIMNIFPTISFEARVYEGGFAHYYGADHFSDGSKISIALTTDKLGKKVFSILSSVIFTGFVNSDSIIKKLVDKYGQYDDKRERNFPTGSVIKLVWDGRIVKNKYGSFDIIPRGSKRFGASITYNKSQRRTFLSISLYDMNLNRENELYCNKYREELEKNKGKEQLNKFKF